MTKFEEVTNPGSCLNKAADDEPIWVFRAQDTTAPYYIEKWADTNATRLGESHPKIVHAREVVAAMRAWRNRKLPD